MHLFFVFIQVVNSAELFSAFTTGDFERHIMDNFVSSKFRRVSKTLATKSAFIIFCVLGIKMFLHCFYRRKPLPALSAVPPSTRFQMLVLSLQRGELFFTCAAFVVHFNSLSANLVVRLSFFAPHPSPFIFQMFRCFTEIHTTFL